MVLLVVTSGCARVGFDAAGDGGSVNDVSVDDGLKVDGLKVDGLKVDGLKVDGLKVDGLKVDGLKDGPADGPEADLKLADGPEADLKSGDSGVVPGTWIAISKGTFLMGAPNDNCPVNSYEHQVTLTHSFEMQSTEVTGGQFLAVMGYDPSFDKTCGGDCPVEWVTWHEAVAYCNTLSGTRGLPACYSCNNSGSDVRCQEATGYTGQELYSCPGYRLPTDAEWEYAYRAGTTTPYYNGVNDPTKCNECLTIDANADVIGWYCANSGAVKHQVQQKQANSWGLYDMAGNVYEWCHDGWSNLLDTAAKTNPIALGNANRVIRGGNFRDPPSIMRAAARGLAGATLPSHVLGFRCTRSLD